MGRVHPQIHLRQEALGHVVYKADEDDGLEERWQVLVQLPNDSREDHLGELVLCA